MSPSTLAVAAAPPPSGSARTILRLALPAMAEAVLMSLVLFVDTVLVGWLRDPAALGAVTLGGSFYFVLQGVFMALGVGGTALTARAWGAGRRDEAAAAAAQALSLGLMAGLAVTLPAALLAGPFLRVMGAEAAVVAVGTHYLHILLVSAPVGLALMVAFACIRASGDTVTPLRITLVYNGLNLVGDLVLIFGLGPVPALGVAGAAWATTGATFVAVALAARAMFGSTTALTFPARALLRWDGGRVRRILRVAVPTLVEVVVQRTGYLVFMGIVTSLGTAALAAHAVGLRVESLSFHPGWGFSVAAAALVGQAMGAGDGGRAERIAWRAAALGAAFMGGCGVVFLVAGPWLVLMFGATPEVTGQAGTLVRISAVAQPFMAVFFVLGGALRGAGDTRTPLVVTLVGTLPLRLGLTWLFAVHWGGGIAGVWWACNVDWLGRAALMVWFFRRGRWRRTTV
jgi:putative MATE family efflux protein